MRVSWLPLAAFTCWSWSLAPAGARADDPAYLGVMLAPIPEELAAHVKVSEGAMVMKVMPGSPADKAGLKRFDVIVSLNGAAAKSADDVRGRIQEAKQGTVVKLGVVRGSETLTLEPTLAAPPAELPEVKPAEPIEKEETEKEEAAQKPAASHKGFLGIGTAEVPPVLSSHLGLADGAGVVVGDVWKDSPAQKAGIEARDVLTAVDGKAIQGAGDFLNTLSGKKAGDQVKIDFIHKGEKKTVEVTLAPRPKDLPRMHGGQPASRDWTDFFGPRTSRKGKVTIQGPDGQEHVIPLPESLWKAEDLFRDLEQQLGQFKDTQIPELKKSLRESLHDLEEKLKDEKDLGDPRWAGSHHNQSSSVVRSVDGEYDITVKDQNGARTVTVLKDGKVLASDLPYQKLDTLPAEVKERVQKTMASLKIGPAPRGAVPQLEEGDKIKA